MIGFIEHWNQYLEAIPAKLQDLYFREEYVRLYETENEKACCFVFQEDKSIMLFPFLRREFEYKSKTYYDFETAYGYGGPISNDHSEAFMTAALHALATKACEDNYICGFIRFHPLLENWDCFVDNNFEYLQEFEDLYNSTMDKLEADGFYYFGQKYYEQLKDTIKNRFLGIVRHEGKVIAGAIFFYQLPYGHYHLAGSDKNALKLSPNNFLLWGAAKELINRGVEQFHLGGGTNGSEDNSLYQYKRKFSKHEYQFVLGKMIFNQALYDDICADWVSANPEKAEKMTHILLKYKY